MTAPDEIPVRRATFATSPDDLHEAFREACSAPGDEFRQLSREVVQCRLLPSPELAALLVLHFDGALEVPALIMEKRTERQNGAHRVEMSYFAEVVKKSGRPRQIYFRQRGMDRIVDDLLRASGGVLG